MMPAPHLTKPLLSHVPMILATYAVVMPARTVVVGVMTAVLHGTRER